MNTLILKDTKENIEKAAQIIKTGGLVAFPTETVYGLGANGLDEVAAGKIYKAKGRPSDNPMILHISDISDLSKITDNISDLEKKLMENFWPGPMTIILERNRNVPNITTGGLDTVGVRMPSNKTALELIKKSEVPIAAPSANISGKPSPTKASHVVDDMQGKIDAIICGEDCEVGIESTVLRVINEEVIILRPGMITPEMIEKTVGIKAKFDPAIEQEEVEIDFKPMAPGMKYRHYAPNAQMLVVQGEEKKVRAKIEEMKEIEIKNGKKVGCIIFGSTDFETAAHNLFSELREMDKSDVDIILAGAVDNKGLGFSVMNRMLKSAGYNVIKV